MKADARFRIAVALAGCISLALPLVGQDNQEPDDIPMVRDARGGITPPRAIYAPEPGYDDASRRAKTQGTVLLTIVVTADGRVKDAKVTKSLSGALDKQAVEAVSQWKFAPATKDGTPITVRINVECTFRIR